MVGILFFFLFFQTVMIDDENISIKYGKMPFLNDRICVGSGSENTVKHHKRLYVFSLDKQREINIFCQAVGFSIS